MTEPAARFFLTRRAALDLRAIHVRSRRDWGDGVADRYVADLYAAMKKAAANPEAGRLRQRRSAPFLMVPAQRHFILYDVIPQGIAVLTLQHQVRDIESLIAEWAPCSSPKSKACGVSREAPLCWLGCRARKCALNDSNTTPSSLYRDFEVFDDACRRRHGQTVFDKTLAQ